MLLFFKSKPTLSEIIPNNFIDIHSHILPGIDDGAQTIENTSFLLSKMKEIGFKKVITTPHTKKNIWDNTPEIIKKTANYVIKTIPKETKEISLSYASEYYIDDHFINLFQNENLLTLKDNYVLVELSYLNEPLLLNEILFQLQLKGYVPVLAHPERYIYYHNNLVFYTNLKKMGCLFQLNLLSTVGYYGKEIKDISEKLLKNNLIDFVGSDIHHKKHIEAFQNKIQIKSVNKLEEAINNNSFFG